MEANAESRATERGNWACGPGRRQFSVGSVQSSVVSRSRRGNSGRWTL